jgi:PhzF family phenazine biosynthesis protein
MTPGIWVIDAFASRPFSGNPAAVAVLGAYPDDKVLQSIAMEMNLSETAFLVKNAALDYQLRWFTPAVEVNLCGHATLAATHMLRETGVVRPGETVTYRTLSGDLRARAERDSIELDFPVLAGESQSPHPALKSLNIPIIGCERNRDNYLVRVKDYDALLACSPDFVALCGLDRQGVIVTADSGVNGFDFASRYFAPSAGVNEDPVTGSAHCFLATYWAKHLGKQSFHALQASARQGILDVTLNKDRVLIAGRAVTTLKAQLQIPLSLPKEHAA